MVFVHGSFWKQSLVITVQFSGIRVLTTQLPVANNNVLLDSNVSNEPTWIPPSYIYYPTEYASIVSVEKTEFSVVVLCVYITAEEK